MTNTNDNLSSMKLAELQALASQMGVKGTSRMRKLGVVSLDHDDFHRVMSL